MGDHKISEGLVPLAETGIVRKDMTWTGSRSLNLGLLLNPDFRVSLHKLILGDQMVKWSRRAGLGMHFQKVLKLSIRGDPLQLIKLMEG